jgi:hypothetical protein
MDHATHAALMAAVAQYFDLMHEADISTFDRIFRPTAQLHGVRNGQMRMLPASEYKKLLAGGPSPKSKGAPREEQILLVDFASATQALVKVRVRVDTIVYVDYLSYHLLGGDWLISAKAFHVESVAAAA